MAICDEVVTIQRVALVIMELFSNPNDPTVPDSMTPERCAGRCSQVTAARRRAGHGVTPAQPTPRCPPSTQPDPSGTYGDAMAEARARLRAGSTYVVTHAGVLAGRAVEIRDRPGAVGAGEAAGPRWVGACRGSGCAKIRLSTVAIQDWCAENKAGYEARRRACTGITKPNTRINSLGPILTLNQGHARGEQVLEKSQPGLLRSLELQKYIYGYI